MEIVHVDPAGIGKVVEAVDADAVAAVVAPGQGVRRAIGKIMVAVETVGEAGQPVQPPLRLQPNAGSLQGVAPGHSVVPAVFEEAAAAFFRHAERGVR